MSKIALDSNVLIYNHCLDFDGIIVAAALEAGCDIIYSEDMHNGLIVENSLKIINPFL